MQLLYLVTILATTGFTYCTEYRSPNCYYYGSKECQKKIALELKDVPSQDLNCKMAKLNAQCQVQLAEKCGFAGMHAKAMKMQKITDEICRKGSKLNTDFEKYKNCYDTEKMSKTCFLPLVDSKDFVLNPTDKQILEAEQKSCGQREKLYGCMSRFIFEDCESKAYAFHQNFILSPMKEMMDEVCTEVIEKISMSSHRVASAWAFRDVEDFLPFQSFMNLF